MNIDDVNEITNDNPEVLNIEWVISNMCNYACSYCTPNLHSNMSGVGTPTGQPKLTNILRFLNFVNKNVNPNKKIITLTGGEPTLWPDLANFVEQVHDSYQVIIVTNGSRTIDWWETFISRNVETKIDVITLSIHLEYADLEHIKKVISILEPTVRVTALIIFKPGMYTKAKEFYENLKDLNVTLFVKPITDRATQTNGYHKAIDYTDEEWKLIENTSQQRKRNSHYKVKQSWMPSDIIVDGKKMPHGYPLQMVAERQNKFKGWWCEMGIKRMAIWYDGEIRAALCGTATKYPIGNINDTEYNPVMGGVCESEYCSCIPDLKVPKWRIK